MNKYILIVALTYSFSLSAQNNLIVLRSDAQSFYYTIDGKKAAWNIVPERKRINLEAPVGVKQKSLVALETEGDPVSYTVNLHQKINFTVLFKGDTMNMQLTGVTKNANFSDSYIKKHRGKFDVQIPEVQELAKIMIALSTAGSSDSGITNMRTAYYREVKEHFTPFKNHPLIDTMNKYIKDGNESSYWYYYDWKMNANGYAFTKDGKIVNKGTIRKMGFKETEDPFVKYADLAADFAYRSGFRKFYASHRRYYDSLLQQYINYNPVNKMKAWLEKHFPYKYDYYLITYSPLTSGAHSTGNFEDKEFNQTVMFIAGVTINPNFSQAVNEMANSRVVFTEIDHNYVNPVADKYAKEIVEAMKNKTLWSKGLEDNSTYADPMSTFQEYMTWAVFSLYCSDYYPENEVLTYVDRMERSMERRGFSNFKAFNRELIRLYQQHNKTRKVHELYPDLIKWCKNQ